MVSYGQSTQKQALHWQRLFLIWWEWKINEGN